MTTDAVGASIVVAIAGCEEWWFGGVGCEKGNKSVTQCDICDYVSSCKCWQWLTLPTEQDAASWWQPCHTRWKM